MPFQDIFNDAKKKHEEEIAASENEKKLEDERQQLIDKEFNLLKQRVIIFLEEAKQFYPKFENYIILTPNKRMLKVVWNINNVEVNLKEEFYRDYDPFGDNFHKKDDENRFYQIIKLELFRFFIKLDTKGNCYYCDGKQKEKSDGFRGKINYLELGLLGNIDDPESIILALQKVMAKRIIEKSFPTIELGLHRHLTSCVNNHKTTVDEIEKCRKEAEEMMMSKDEAVAYILQAGRFAEDCGVGGEKRSLEWLLS